MCPTIFSIIAPWSVYHEAAPRDLISSPLADPVHPSVISADVGNLLKAMSTFIHQTLVHADPHLYALERVEAAICRHPELTWLLCQAFQQRFHPDCRQEQAFAETNRRFLKAVARLDTGRVRDDDGCRHVWRQGMNFITHVLKTNFYCPHYAALSFRLDPRYLNALPFERARQFPDLPYAIFFIQGVHFFGFHIRFKDLARGGLRTVQPEDEARMRVERDQVFTECYHLAWTQHKKNKDIPEGGAKGLIFLQSCLPIARETALLKSKWEGLNLHPDEMSTRVHAFQQAQKQEYLYRSQRAFIDSLITLVHTPSQQRQRARFMVDYWRQPEYLYLGPDEQMHDGMIEWIANFSKQCQYRPGGAFISGKSAGGIHHKAYGVTSLGLNIYTRALLEYMGIRPEKEAFTVKMSGGPDGDVAGNQLLNFYRYYPGTAQVVALTDQSGTISDPRGLDLAVLAELFKQGKGISHYPPQKLSLGGFLMPKDRKRRLGDHRYETLCWRQGVDGLAVEWLSEPAAQHLWQHNVHQTPADIFIPAGGRPRTLNETRIGEFLDPLGRPTARAIVEGANLYLDGPARRTLEEKGVLIIKDSSANKGGVICSSWEVLCGLTLDEATFIQHKEVLVSEIIEHLTLCAAREAQLLLKTHQQSGAFLTEISERLSERINQYTDQIMDYLDALPFPADQHHPLVRCFLNGCLPTLRRKFRQALLTQIPDSHKKAVVAARLASHRVYQKGIGEPPLIPDVLALILSDSALN